MENFENRLNQTLKELKTYWQTQQPMILQKLTNVINFAEANPKIAYLYFEHDFEYLDIGYYFENKDRMLLNDYTDFIDNLLPKTIFNQEIDMADEATESDENEELFDEYSDKKIQNFEQWFLDCWQKAKQQHAFSKRSFFSIHDSYFILDLQQEVTVKGDSLEPTNLS